VSRVPSAFLELDDEQLDRAIAEMLESANWPGFDNFAQLPPELKIELVAAGVRERERRTQAVSAARVLRIAYSTLAASIVALIVAVIAAVTS
jgi:hypothetical protein